MRQNRKGHCDSPGCTSPIYAKRLCTSHWQKARYTPRGKPTIVDTFDQQYAADSNGCFVWLRARSGKEAAKGGGYGCFRIGKKMVLAHAYAWTRVHGEIPAGLQVRHQCHNTLCVNVAHMLLGTNDQNVQDRIDAGRYAKKLTPEKVREIRAAVAAGETQRSVAARFGIANQHVSDLVARRMWRHVE